MAGFKLLANVFFTQIKSVSNCRNHGRNIVCTIMHSPLYKPICKLFNSDPDLQAYITTSAQAIAEREICKLTLNTALKLLIKAVDLICLKIFNIVAVNKKH